MIKKKKMGGCIPSYEKEDGIEWTRNSIENQSLNTIKKKYENPIINNVS